MILRRFIKSLKNQDWTAVCIELLILIVGIYIGLQVNNWQTQLKEKQQAAELIMRLQEDLAILESENKEVEQALIEQLDRFDKTIAFVKEDASWQLEYDEWIKHLRPLMGYPNPVVEFPVYEEMLATAQMKSIYESDIKRALTTYSVRLKDTKDSNDAFERIYAPAYQDIFNHLTDLKEFPHIVKETIEKRKIELVRSLYIMRQTVGFVHFSVKKNAEDAKLIIEKLNKAKAD